MDLSVAIFADCVDLDAIGALALDDRVAGFTTNPTLMRQAGVTDYVGHAKRILDCAAGKPVSFEVFTDDPRVMVEQARIIQSWGDNVVVKVPVTTTTGESTLLAVRAMRKEDISVNVTAILEPGKDVKLLAMRAAPLGDSPFFFSVFAGRIADTGRDPKPFVSRMVGLANGCGAEVIWASAREVLNVRQAEEVGCHIITLTPALIAKLDLFGKPLVPYSRETVQMFYQDAATAGYTL